MRYQATCRADRDPEQPLMLAVEELHAVASALRLAYRRVYLAEQAEEEANTNESYYRGE